MAAGASGFLTLIQSGERPDRYGRSRRLATMPSRLMADRAGVFNEVPPSLVTAAHSLDGSPGALRRCSGTHTVYTRLVNQGRIPRRRRCGRRTAGRYHDEFLQLVAIASDTRLDGLTHYLGLDVVRAGRWPLHGRAGAQRFGNLAPISPT